MILGLSGKALSGKDTVADYLISNHGWDKKIGFATNLKSACSMIFDLSNYQVSSQEGKSSYLEEPIFTTKRDIVEILRWMRTTHAVELEDRDFEPLLGKRLMTPRDILQFVGTEVMRYYIPSYHTDVVFNSMISGDMNVIITDVRFPNEYNDIKNYGGEVVRINRPLELRVLHGIVANGSHPSEISLDSGFEFKYTIDNIWKDLDCLYRQVDEMLTVLNLKR